MKNPLKEKVRCWFEFLCLARRLAENNEGVRRDVEIELGKSLVFYERWGSYSAQDFNAWWVGHHQLFDCSRLSVITFPTSGQILSEEALYVRIPYFYAPSTVGRIVAGRYGREMLKRRSISATKVKKSYGGAYEINPLDFPVRKFRHYYVFARDVYLPLRCLDRANRDTEAKFSRARQVFARLEKRSRVKGTFPFQIDTETERRRVRRWWHIVDRLLLNAAQGSFPGSY